MALARSDRTQRRLPASEELQTFADGVVILLKPHDLVIANCLHVAQPAEYRFIEGLVANAFRVFHGVLQRVHDAARVADCAIEIAPATQHERAFDFTA